MFTLLLSKSRKAIVVYDSLFEPKSFDFERDESIVTVVLRMIDRGKADIRFCLFCLFCFFCFFTFSFSLDAYPITQVLTGKSHLSLLSDPQRKLRSYFFGP